MNTSNHRGGWKDTTVQTLEIWEGEKKFKEKLKGQMGCEVFKGNETKYNSFNLSLITFKNFNYQSKI